MVQQALPAYVAPMSQTQPLMQQSFEQLFQEYYQVLCLHAAKYLDDAAACEDAVCEVFARLWEKRESVQIDTSVKSYLYRAVGNQCIDTLRKAYYKKVTLVDSGSTLQHYVDTNDLLLNSEVKELQQRLQLAIENLPRQCGIIFKLSRDAGLKYAEIAAALNLSVKTVETQMGRAFKALRKVL